MIFCFFFFPKNIKNNIYEYLTHFLFFSIFSFISAKFYQKFCQIFINAIDENESKTKKIDKN